MVQDDPHFSSTAITIEWVYLPVVLVPSPWSKVYPVLLEPGQNQRIDRNVL